MSVDPAPRWNAGDYARNAGFVPALGAPVLGLLNPRGGERILDLGCGDGVLTARIGAAGATVIGVDASPDMVAAARARRLDARVLDGTDAAGWAALLAGEAPFDAVFSNAALHWMLDPGAVAAGVFAALKAGGRFVGEMGGVGNIAAIRAALRAELDERGYPPPAIESQWYASPETLGWIYGRAGFVDIEAELIGRPTLLPTGITGWLRTFRAGFLDALGVPEAEQDAVARAVERRLEPGLRQPDGRWIADYVRLRFTMRKPA